MTKRKEPRAVGEGLVHRIVGGMALLSALIVPTASLLVVQGGSTLCRDEGSWCTSGGCVYPQTCHKLYPTQPCHCEDDSP